MRRYEMMVILSDQLDDDAARALAGRIESQVESSGGTTHDVDWWGKRQLAYEIDHRNYGHYVVFDMEIGPEALAELERQLKINDDVVRFKTVRPDVRVRKPSPVRVRNTG